MLAAALPKTLRVLHLELRDGQVGGGAQPRAPATGNGVLCVVQLTNGASGLCRRARSPLTRAAATSEHAKRPPPTALTGAFQTGNPRKTTLPDDSQKQSTMTQTCSQSKEVKPQAESQPGKKESAPLNPPPVQLTKSF